MRIAKIGPDPRLPRIKDPRVLIKFSVHVPEFINKDLNLTQVVYLLLKGSIH